MGGNVWAVQGGGSDDHYGEEDVEDMEKFVLFFAEEEGCSEEDHCRQVSWATSMREIFDAEFSTCGLLRNIVPPKRYA